MTTDAKPAALTITDLLGYKHAHAEAQRAQAELRAAQAAVKLAQQDVTRAADYLEGARRAIAQGYELTDGDSFDRFTGAITRAPLAELLDADQGDEDDAKSPPAPKPNGKQEMAPNVA